jgi:thioredoxin reductase (NADPH)
VHDTVVLGGGVAGLTAALFAARYGCSTLVLVPDMPGGQLATIDRVDDFPGFVAGIAGYELGPALQEQAANAGAEFQMADAERLEPIADGWRIATSDGEVEGRSIIVATGSRPRELGVPGEARLRSRGVSHCASCDGPLLRGKIATVVGAGDSGLQEALTLASFTAQVLIVDRAHHSAAQEVYQRRVREHAGISLRGSTVIEEILGENTVSAVRLRDMRTDAVSVWETAAVFVYVGLEPNTVFLRDVLRLDGSGHIPTDIWMRTELPGLFAAGDVRADSASQAIAAAGDGATAAVAAHRYLASISEGARWHEGLYGDRNSHGI